MSYLYFVFCIWTRWIGGGGKIPADIKTAVKLCGCVCELHLSAMILVRTRPWGKQYSLLLSLLYNIPGKGGLDKKKKLLTR